jgi:4-hydroxybenzoate polyprenyltransferase
VKKYFEFVRFSHTVFALPFALASMMVASAEHRGWPGWRLLGLIVAAVICTRTAAMGFNRIADRKFDALNPRTAKRHLPAGEISLASAWLLTLASAAGLVLVSRLINPLCFALSPVALAVVLFYSVTKRFTNWTHFFLGLALGIAPVGAWLAVRGEFAWPPVVLGLAVVFWLTGFDIIYATQDLEFDRAHGLKSVPVRFGLANSLRIAWVAHVVMWGLLVGFGLISGRGGPYFAGCVVVAGFLVYEHQLARRGDPVSVNIASLRINGIISCVLLASVVIDVVLKGAG